MRWEAKTQQQDDYHRTKERFLLLPKCIAGEWRWLEQARWAQMMIRRRFPNGACFDVWEDTEWQPMTSPEVVLTYEDRLTVSLAAQILTGGHASEPAEFREEIGADLFNILERSYEE